VFFSALPQEEIRAQVFWGNLLVIGIQLQYQFLQELFMNSEKVVFAFFIVLALTLNFGFFIGDLDNPVLHNVYELYAALVVSVIATVLKFGDRTHLGAVFLAPSLVADLQLVAAAVVWGSVEHIAQTGMDAGAMAAIVSLSGGALLANITSVVLLVAETMSVRR
jgi:hypothetical protein